MSEFNPPEGERIPIRPKEELLHDADPISPIKTNTLKRKERPTDKDVCVLVKTEHRSSLSIDSIKQSLSEKQAKELPESRDQNPLENLNNGGTRFQRIVAAFEAAKSARIYPVNPQIKAKGILPVDSSFGHQTQMQRLFAWIEAAMPPPVHAINPQLKPKSSQPLGSQFNRENHIRSILASFEAAKSQPVHAINPQLKAKYVPPLLPYFDWDDDGKLVVENLDSDPTANSEIHGELNAEDRVELECKPNKNTYDGKEDVSYSRGEDYHCDGPEASDTSTATSKNKRGRKGCS